MAILNGPAVACKERGFSVQSSRMAEALNGLEEAVSNLDGAFSPVLVPEPPQPTGENAKVCERPSEWVQAMNGFIERINIATAHVRNICRRSEI